MNKDRDTKPDYICIALACLMVVVVALFSIADKPKTSKQTKDRLTTLETHVFGSEESK